MTTTLKTFNRYRTLLEIIFIFVAPVLLLYFEVIPRNYYLAVLAIYTSFVFILIFKEHWTLKTLDIRLDNIKKTTIPYVIFTVLGVAVLIAFATLLGKERVSINLYILFLGWSIPIGIVQEFLYRGFLMHELRRVYTSVATIVLVNAIIFAFLHILYKPPLIILPITFLGGIAFAWMYTKYPNLLLIALSHGVLNFVAIWYGFF